ncbi:MAG: VCBS repeat-containing protein [Deltaproteobacteria bacterium]|nr:VCBS repeat-containing protein [Deltaproteobacteria bacterium]
MKRIILLLVFTASNAFAAPNYFTRYSDTAFDHAPQGVLVGNFTGSTSLDAFVVFPTQNVISQMSLGANGAYTLIADPNTSTIVSPYDLIAGDFNKDSHLDIYYYSNLTDADLLTYQNISNGKVHFNSTNVSTSHNNDIFDADVNNDSNLDIISIEDNLLVFFQGNGAGAFPSFRDEEGTVVTLNKLTVSNFNADAYSDVAVTTATNKVFIYSGRAGDSIPPYPKIAILDVGHNPQGIQAGLLDNNTSQDLIVANHDDDTLSILLNDGTGTAFTATTLSVCNGPYNLVIADFNADSKNDVAVICNADGAVNQGVLQVYAGNGDGTFVTTPIFTQNLGTNPFKIVTDDFNHDGHADLLISVTGSNKIVTLLGNKEPTLSSPLVDSTTGVFQVTYTDADNEPPSSITVTVDGTAIDMTAADSTDTTYTDGKIYHATHTLAEGSHSYRFAASDGTYNAVGNPASIVTTDQSVTVAPAAAASSSGGCSLSPSPKVGEGRVRYEYWIASILVLGGARILRKVKA